MENINGGLGFAATLDIDDFNVSADAMEQHIRRVSTNVQSEAADMEQSLLDFAQKGAMYIQSYLVGHGMTGLLQSIVQVRGQFQQLEIAFGTMLGSEQAAKDLMDQMIETAARTPFDLAGVAGGAKQLLAYGTAADKVNDTLVRLGNIASGLSIPLNDIVYLYGTTMVQGRLYAQDVRQFTGRGIPLVKELAKMYGVTADEINNMVSAGKIGFPDVEKVINSLTDEGGQFYNLMAKQSASLTGMVSNLEDAWDSMLNDIGTANQDVFADAISSATYLVEHYQDILDILKAITIAYGSYKAAIVLNTLVTKGYTGVALIDNTVRQAKIGLMRAEAIATGQVAAQTKAMQAAQEAHVATLEREMTAEELANLKKQLRIATIQSLLTAQQAEYLSNLGLTASSEGYEAAALQVMTVEQQQAVQKLDLTSKSAIYRAALEQEVAAKRGNAQAAKEQAAAELEAMRVEVSASAKRMESSKQAAIVAMQKVEAARYELYWTRQNGDATAIATAQKKLEGAQDNMAISRKAALAASTDFYNKKKALEVAATRQSIVASTQDATAKGVQTAATNILSAATNKATLAIRTLWATMKANPLGWILTLVGLVASAFTLFRKEEEETTDVMGEFQDTTKKEIENLDLLFAILQSTDKETKTHKDVMQRVDAICKEYNKTLTDEKGNIKDLADLYGELTQAIQETTAEKVRAKYIEQALKDEVDAHAKSLESLKDAAEEATHKEFAGYQQTYNARGSSGQTATYKEVGSTNIRHAGDLVWEMVEDEARQATQKLKGLTGQAYNDTYNEILNNIANAVQKASKATGTEISAFKPKLKEYLDSYIETSNGAQKEIEKIDEQLTAFLKPKDPEPVTEATDLISLSFADLDSKLQSAQEKMAGYTELSKEQLAEMSEAGQKMIEQFQGGNVDLLARPLIDAAELVKKGWEDAGEGIATVYSMQQQVKDSKGQAHEILFTPILPDGTVLSPDELQTYISETLEGADDILKADNKGIIIQMDADPDGSAGELLHNLQEIYYLCDQDASVKIDTGKLQEMTATLGELLRLATTIETKTANLNTDAGISARIKELREMIATEEYGSEQRRKHTQELLALQSKMDANNGTKRTGGKGNTKEQAERNAEAYAQKQLEAQRKLEEARIEVMEEGYARRKATLDLQHQLTLEQIDKEERELEKARAKSGGSKGVQTVASTNIRGADADVWASMERNAREAVDRLSGLSGQAYTDTYNQVFASMVSAIRNATNASGAEIDAFKPKLKEYLDAYISAANSASAEAGNMGSAMEAQARSLERLAQAASTATYQTHGLTNAERQLFQERRNLANQQYTTESNKLFDGEIDYKKKQYEAYFQWVRNVGQDVADAHFKTLIAEGSSFTAWINRQIADLEAKRATDPSTFTDGDANALNALRMQQNEINGTKSAMDLFRESVSRTVGQAQTLAEKLQAVANLKERLAKGEFHLNQDETAAASYQLNQQDSDLQREVQDKVLTEYRTYEERKKSIQDEYALLRAEAQKMNDQERIRMINEAEAEELSNLNANMLKQSDAWKRLFTNLESLTATELAELISGMQSQLNNADLKLSPVDYKALMDSLDKAKQELISKNPFKALDQFYNDYIKAKERLAKAKASVAAGKGSDKDVKDAQGEVKKAAKGMTDTVEQLTDTAVECGNAIASIFDSMGNDELADGLGNAVEMMGALGDAAASYGKIMSGDIMGGISGMAQSVSSIVGIFTKMHDAKYEKRIEQLQNDIDALETSYTRLERAFNNTYWVFDENQKAGYEQNIELIKQQIKALEAEAEAARKSWRFGEYSRINKEIKELQQTLKNSKESGDMFSIYEAQKENLRQQQEDIRQQIEAEKDKKKTDNDRIKQWEEQIEQITMQIEDLDRSMQETLAGTTVKNAIDEFADALTEAFAQGENAAEALGKKTKEVLKNAVVEALKRQFLAKGINDAVAYLGDAMKDNVLSDNERATFEAMVNHAGDLYRHAMEGVADLIKDVEDDTNVDALTGAVQGMSEETGGLVAGRLNAVIINQGEHLSLLGEFFRWVREHQINLVYPETSQGGTQSNDELITLLRQLTTPNEQPTANSIGFADMDLPTASQVERIAIGQNTSILVLREQVLSLVEISQNTGNTVAELKEIKAMVNRLANSENPLLAQGIV